MPRWRWRRSRGWWRGCGGWCGRRATGRGTASRAGRRAAAAQRGGDAGDGRATERGQDHPRDQLRGGDADPTELLREQQRADAAERAADRAADDAAATLDRAHDAPHEHQHTDHSGGRARDARHGCQRRATGDVHPDGLFATPGCDFDLVQPDPVRRDLVVDAEVRVVVLGSRRDGSFERGHAPDRGLDLDPHGVRVGGCTRLHAMDRVDVELERVLRRRMRGRRLTVDERAAAALRLSRSLRRPRLGGNRPGEGHEKRDEQPARERQPENEERRPAGASECLDHLGPVPAGPRCPERTFAPHCARRKNSSHEMLRSRVAPPANEDDQQPSNTHWRRHRAA